jgi:hypothetical protein
VILICLLGCYLRDAAHQGIPVPDHRLFERWLAAEGRTVEYHRFERRLREAGVEHVVPAWQLWRQGTDWRDVGHPAFAVPPEAAWSAMVPTLRVLRDEVVPLVGPVEVVSGFRTDAYNAAAGGAPGSRHRWFEAIDVVPTRAWARESLHAQLLGFWERQGRDVAMGLGLYQHTRFHVDTWKYRRW